MRFQTRTKYFCTLGILTLALHSGLGQNVVLNESMDSRHIPTGLGLITKTDTWTNANGGTVDLFDASKSKKCTMQNGIPKNFMGEQSSFSAGHNYAGIIAYYDDGSNNASIIMTCGKRRLFAHKIFWNSILHRTLFRF